MLNTIFSIALVVSSFTAQFVQVKSMQIMQQEQRSEGRLTYQAPDYLRWEYEKPDVLVWELRGDEGNMSRQLKGMVMLIRQSISGDFEAAKADFEVVEEGNVVTLTPKKRELKRMFSTIRITLNKDTGIADTVEMTEGNGDYTIITFYNVKPL